VKTVAQKSEIPLRSLATSTTVKTDFESKAIIKEAQGKLLIKYCSQLNL